MPDPNDFDHPGSGTPTALPGGFRAAINSALAGLGLRGRRVGTGWSERHRARPGRRAVHRPVEPLPPRKNAEKAEWRR